MRHVLYLTHAVHVHVQGWFPLYDTLKGARGELSLSVKLQFIGNENPFRDSSAGVRFFLCSMLNPEVRLLTRLHTQTN